MKNKILNLAFLTILVATPFGCSQERTKKSRSADSPECEAFQREAQNFMESGALSRITSGTATEAEKAKWEELNTSAASLQGKCPGFSPSDSDTVDTSNKNAESIFGTLLNAPGLPNVTAPNIATPTPSEAPVATQRPSPTPSSTPTLSPSPSPRPPWVPNVSSGPICGAAEKYITLNGVNAFFFSSDTERFQKLLELFRSGSCQTQKTVCGVNGSFISLDGKDSFFFSDSAERFDRFLELQASKVCKPLELKCGVRQSYISLEGKDAFFVSDSMDRFDLFIKLFKSNSCQLRKINCGVRTTYITLDNNDAFYIPSDSVRFDKTLELKRNYVCDESLVN